MDDMNSETDAKSSDNPSAANQEPVGVSETIQSLLVAFVVAMIARGFILEGFVIPTGSMAPTLMGQHVRLKSPQTGFSYAIDGNTYGRAWSNAARILMDASNAMRTASNDAQRARIRNDASRRALLASWDPMFGLTEPVERNAPNPAAPPDIRAGDRVLVLKTIYPFTDPDRFDVVVLKNPTDPVGLSQNFIKRLVGLPEEQLVTVDGDIFTGPLDATPDQLSVVRKPESVQRAVWQPVYESSYQPIALAKWEEQMHEGWWGSPFVPETGDVSWSIDTDRTWRCTTRQDTALVWNGEDWPITNFNGYNLYRTGESLTSPLTRRLYAMSDVRVAGTIEPSERNAGTMTALSLEARGMRMTWRLVDDEAQLRIERIVDESLLSEASAPFALPSDAFDVEFWHVDQQLWLFVDGDLIVQLPFDGFSPEERFLASFPGTSIESYLRDPLLPRPEPATLRWSFGGGGLALRNVQVDRDLYYRPQTLDSRNQYATNGRVISGLGFGTDLRKPARLEANQFLMMGDNSAASRDGRIWGRPHPLAAAYSGDDSPFIVPRKLLVGKAFSVYFPAPLPAFSNKFRYVVDFGRLRFIR